jgi:RNA polymerase sigma-70 factor (ECF subfamily)
VIPDLPLETTMNDYTDQLASLRPQLLRFAKSQLRNEAWAEDAVSETLLAAIENPAAFKGDSQFKTWLISILRHKVIDQFRRHRLEALVSTSEDEVDFNDLLFHADGHWRDEPQDWGHPEAVMQQRQFFQVLETCCDHLPQAQGRAFMMREWLGLGTEEICRELQVKPGNLWVLLHRARLRLQVCLQESWFSSEAPVVGVAALRVASP